MIYIFEDDIRDPIPSLFLQSYDINATTEFIYTKGNGNIYKKVEGLINSNDTIIVYLDTIPGNIETRRLYNKLLKLSRRNNKSIIVLPILGAEYYFIKSIHNKPIVIDKDSVNICVNNKSYFNSAIISTQEDKKYCKYYERFCKLVLNKAVMDCVRNSEDNGNNTQFRWYYNKKCRCEKSLDICESEELKDKSNDLLCAYPCIPSNSLINNKKSLNIQDIWNIHRILVDEHNELCDELANNDPDKSKTVTYKYINYI